MKRQHQQLFAAGKKLLAILIGKFLWQYYTWKLFTLYKNINI